MFRLDPGLELNPQKHGQIAVGDAFEQGRFPAKARRGHRDASDRVADVVVAVAEGPFAVLPRLAPVDRRETDQNGSFGQLSGDPGPRFVRQLQAEFHRMRERGVMVDRGTRMKAGGRPGDQVALGRMKIAA